MKIYDVIELSKLTIQELCAIAFSEFDFIPKVSGKQTVIYQILDQQNKIINNQTKEK